MLPVLDGVEVCQQLRGFSNVPVIMLTAKGDDMDKIIGLEHGADDYMTKPFNIIELKVRPGLRRSFAAASMGRRKAAERSPVYAGSRLSMSRAALPSGTRRLT
jgi:DNA-binding response OmpR family regulator